MAFLPLSALLAALACAEGATSYEPPAVVVTGTRIGTPFPARTRSVEVVTAGDLARKGARSVPDALGMAFADVACRGPEGTQSEVSLRGSTYSQVLVMVDGVPVNDPQTAHHGLDLPVTMGDLGRLEVLKGPGSSAHGADALGGAVNLVTAPVTGRSARFLARVADRSTRTTEASASERAGPLGQSIAYRESRSEGFGYDRDFASRILTARSSVPHPGGEASLFLGMSDREFGAFDFYTPGLGYPSREWTRARLGVVTDSLQYRRASLKLSAHQRLHFDRFMLDRTRPAKYLNEHTTHTGGFSAEAGYDLGRPGRSALGMELVHEGMDSASLGSRARDRRALFAAHRLGIGTLDLDGGLRADDSDWGSTLSPSAGAGWRPLPALRLRASAGRAFRVPSFTEMYYRDPANAGNPGLEPETAVSAEAGADLSSGGASAGVTGFVREQDRTIDWIGPTVKGPWRAVNAGRIRFTGVEGSARAGAGPLDLALGLGWTASRTSCTEFSKYALAYARRWAGARLGAGMPFGLRLAVGGKYLDRADGADYGLLDARLSMSEGPSEVFVECSNILDRRYEEVRGVPGPGRWLGGGLSISFEAPR
jgi:iron complex outermembrane receptor protein